MIEVMSIMVSLVLMVHVWLYHRLRRRYSALQDKHIALLKQTITEKETQIMTAWLATRGEVSAQCEKGSE